ASVLNTPSRFVTQTFVNPLLSAGVFLSLLFFCLAAHALDPANPKASPKARAILNYLQGLGARQDKRFLSGQFTGFGTGASLRLMDEIHERTGQWLALVGTDYPDLPRRTVP